MLILAIFLTRKHYSIYLYPDIIAIYTYFCTLSQQFLLSQTKTISQGTFCYQNQILLHRDID